MNLSRQQSQIRRVSDKSDGFAHQVVGGLKERKTPDWVKSNKTIAALLLRSFPKLETTEPDRSRAARWARVIHLYFRCGFNSREVSNEMGVKVKTIVNIIQRINRVSKGLKANGQRTNGTNKLGAAPRHRPKKI